MNNNIRKKIEYLQSKKSELQKIDTEICTAKNLFEEKMRIEREKFKNSLESINELKNKKQDEYNSIADDTISIGLEDLLNEISSITGISVSEMGISISGPRFWGKHSLYKLSKLISSPSQDAFLLASQFPNEWYIYIYANKDFPLCEDSKQPFCYAMRFYINFYEIQKDGKPFLAHCSNVIYHNYEKCSTALMPDKNIGSLNLNISLKSLLADNHYIDRWYPKDLLLKAVINCAEKTNKPESNNKKYQKIRKDQINRC